MDSVAAKKTAAPVTLIAVGQKGKTLEFFKYLHPERTDVLENLKIRFTQAFALNDPFESFPGIIQESKEWYWKRFIEIVNSEMERIDIQSLSKRKQYFRERKKEFANFYRCHTDEEWLFEQAKSIALMDSVIQGYLSLSATNRNTLMWSHYAHNHKGYVLGFDSNHSFFSYGTIKIDYSETRPGSILLRQDRMQPYFIPKALIGNMSKNTESLWHLLKP